jgi:hypothetical protein
MAIRVAAATTRTRKMNTLMLSDVASLSTSVVFLALVGVVVLLSVRACCEVLQVNLTRLVVGLLDGSIVVMFITFLALVIVRFKIIG